jgi:formylglycine-generating enzyme required for sulfatase activity
MHGNVYEWCLDWYGDYGSEQATDPAGPSEGTKKVARGGCYLSGTPGGRPPEAARDQQCFRSAARGRFLPDLPLPIIGLRIVLAPEIRE